MPNYAHVVSSGIWKWNGDYWFEDETNNFEGNGPFATQEEAIEASIAYAKGLEGPNED